ncbi:alpha/beta hydrolase [Stenotrophomonas pavanii]|uniref:alpha/beta hydrolase n=1 Tax=Stenotrophomonas pavanii TaxID=487698 RepID=UPI0039C5E130
MNERVRTSEEIGAFDVDYAKSIGADDGSLIGNAVEAIKGAAGKLGDKLHPLVEQYATLFKTGLRTPVMRTPSDYGMAYQETWFPSMDGVPLEAWYIPADSDRLLIINHPMTCNRYGFPGHLPEFKKYFGGFEVNFLPELRHLHDAGYNILTYDLRNCGRSGQANGGISGLGLLECRDVVGSVRYAREHHDMGKMQTSLYSRCMGGNSTIIAMQKWPEEFENIKALALLNVVSGPTFIERGAQNLHLDSEEAAHRLDQRCRETSGFSLFDFRPQNFGSGVTLPVFMAQLRRDFMIHGEKDGQEIFDSLSSRAKELMWIEESNQRFYAYNHFGQQPARLVEWFNTHMN